MHRVEGLIVVAAVLALVGCATIIHGGTQEIRVTSQPSGAVVRIPGLATTTPGVLKLQRRKLYTLVFEKEGYKPVEVQLKKTVDGWLFGNIIFGGLVGLAIDFGTGAAYKLTPAEVNVVLGRQGASLGGTKEGVVVFVDFENLPRQTREAIVRQNKQT